MVSVSKTLILVKSGDNRQENKKNLSPAVQSSPVNGYTPAVRGIAS